MMELERFLRQFYQMKFYRKRKSTLILLPEPIRELKEKRQRIISEQKGFFRLLK